MLLRAGLQASLRQRLDGGGEFVHLDDEVAEPGGYGNCAGRLSVGFDQMLRNGRMPSSTYFAIGWMPPSRYHCSSAAK